MCLYGVTNQIRVFMSQRNPTVLIEQRPPTAQSAGRRRSRRRWLRSESRRCRCSRFSSSSSRTRLALSIAGLALFQCPMISVMLKPASSRRKVSSPSATDSLLLLAANTGAVALGAAAAAVLARDAAAVPGGRSGGHGGRGRGGWRAAGLHLAPGGSLCCQKMLSRLAAPSHSYCATASPREAATTQQ